MSLLEDMKKQGAVASAPASTNPGILPTKKTGGLLSDMQASGVKVTPAPVAKPILPTNGNNEQAPTSLLGKIGSYNPLYMANKAVKDVGTQAIKGTWDTYAKTPGKIAEDINAAASDFTSATKEKTALGQIAGGAKAAIKAGGRVAADSANAIFAPVTNAFGAVMDKTGANAAIESGAQKVVDWSGIADIPAVQEFATKHPNAAEDFNRALMLVMSSVKPNAAENKITTKGMTDVVKTGVEVPIQAAKDFVGAIKETPNPFKSLESSRIKSNTIDWTKPALENKATFKPAKQILAKDPTIPKFLSENGMAVGDNVIDGKYATAENAGTLRSSAGKMSRETLRPSLEQANNSVPNVPVDANLATQALNYAKNTFHVTAGDLQSIAANIAKELQALRQKYADGMSLTDLHDEKITYADNGGFSPVKDPAVNNTAIANRAISDALYKTLVENVPADIPVIEFNSYLSKFYKAADYLESLNTKKVPTSFAQKIAQGTAKLGGAITGGLLGGGIPGEFAGYQVGRAIEAALENLPTKARDAFIRNIKQTNPEAYTRVENYLGEQKAAQATRPLLPEAKTIFSPEQTQSSIQKGIDESGVVHPETKGPGGLYEYQQGIKKSQQAAGIYKEPKPVLPKSQPKGSPAVVKQRKNL